MTRYTALFAMTLVITAAGCAASPEAPVGPDLSAAKAAATGINVTSADPPYGKPGDVAKQVRIFGSGFAAGAKASWQRGGVDDPKIQVHSTQFVSSTELLATITIAGDATLDFYDIAVTLAGRKGGIGTMLFEVTQAIPVFATESGFGVNDNGEIVGRLGPAGSFFFNPGTGLESLNVPGRAYDLSADGRTVAGFTGVCCAGAFVLEHIGGTWSQTVLSKGNSAWAGARAVASDPAGVGVIVGGVRGDGGSNNLLRKPTLWTRNGSGWALVTLPNAGTDDVVDDVVGSGLAVGWANDRAAVWTPSAGGVWVLSLIGPARSRLHGLNTAGTLAVGEVTGSGNTTLARYWAQSGGSWSAPLSLPGGCSSAAAVDDSGRILANGCLNGNRRAPAVILPPYSSANIVFLGGLGDSRNQVIAEDISPSGLWITGQALLKNNGIAVRWPQVF